MSARSHLCAGFLLACFVASGVADLRARTPQQPPSPVRRLACGGYEVVPSGTAADGQPTRISIQKGGRLLLNVGDGSITRVTCDDVEADRTMELLVDSTSGDAQCCHTLHVWALGDTPRKLLEYPAGNAGGFDLRDLDGDGRQELLVGDDSFAYFGDLCYGCSPNRLPMVLCRVERGFEDCTTKHPAVLREALATFTNRLRPPARADDLPSIQGAALGALALWSLLGEEDQGLASIRAAVASDEIAAWLERARPQIRDWKAARSRKVKDRR